MTRPLISVILPTYNRAATLHAAVGSVLAQTLPDLELIVVDDASTDSTRDRLAEWSDSRVRVHLLEECSGPAAARNAGLNLARGSFVAFQDSDDEWDPRFLERLYGVLVTAAQQSLTFCRFWRVSDGRVRLHPLPERFDVSEAGRWLLRGNFFSTQTTLMPRLWLERAGRFDEALPALVDWDLFLRLADVGPFLLVDDPLAWVRASPDSVSRQPRRLAAAYERIIAKYEGRFRSEPGVMARHCLAAGGLWCQCGEMRRGQMWLRRALQLAPASPETIVTYGLSWLGPEVYGWLAAWRRGVSSHG